MNEVETKIYRAILEMEKLDDNKFLHVADIESLRANLIEFKRLLALRVGRRIIAEGKNK